MFHLLLWLLTPADSFLVSLDEAGLFRETNFTLFKTPAGYLLNSATEARAVLFDARGRIIGRYEEKGKGPKAFNIQYLMAVDEGGLHFCSDRRNLLSFDHHMQLQKSSPYPRLSADLAVRAGFGVLSKGRVILPLLGKDHLVTELEVHKGSWRKVRDHIPTEGLVLNPNTLILSERALIHGDTLFKARVGISRRDDRYEVMVYNEFMKDRDPNPSLALIGPVDDLPVGRGLRCMVYAVAAVPDGYIVELFTHMKKNSRSQRRHDYFDKQGRFLKRVERNSVRLLPVINGSETFLVTDKGDERVLQRME
ncbi:MAG: hypothetical protein QNK37_23495 [Acidobacteriota bacterium]|nr:hypothetical protein [Acidobacteriota bacterium]